jgi:hypothetical protein
MSETTKLPPHPDPELAAWEASEKEKWDALDAHMTPQFEGVREQGRVEPPTLPWPAAPI